MQNYKFNVSGKTRKQLVMAISEVFETEAIYKKAPTYSYEIGNLVVDRNGTVIGEFPFGLLTVLAERGFVPKGDAPEDAPALETKTPEGTSDPEIKTSEDSTTPEAQAPENPAQPKMTIDSISIDVPLDGFSPEAIDNLVKMVSAKEPLIKSKRQIEPRLYRGGSI